MSLLLQPQTSRPGYRRYTHRDKSAAPPCRPPGPTRTHQLLSAAPGASRDVARGASNRDNNQDIRDRGFLGGKATRFRAPMKATRHRHGACARAAASTGWTLDFSGAAQRMADDTARQRRVVTPSPSTQGGEAANAVRRQHHWLFGAFYSYRDSAVTTATYTAVLFGLCSFL